MNRRNFIKAGALFAAAPAIGADAPREFKAAVVGCGGRGAGWGGGAAGNLQEAAKIAGCTVKLVAFADFFLEKAEAANQKLADGKGKVFGGANGYKEIMAMPEVDIVILTTPLNFRPRHTMAAVKAGKHVFAEKGVAVDGPGVREMIAASKLAEEKKLTIVCGTQRRHQRGYLLQKKMLDSGLIGSIVGGEVYWNGSVPWVRERTAGMTNKAYLCNNWLNFAELSGDHICEQHVHNIDVANWFLGRYPKSVVAFGARARRHSGNQYDMFSGDFDYGDGVHIHSMCRQIDECKSDVREFFITDERFQIAGGQAIRGRNGKIVEMLGGDFPDVSPYVQEHVDLLNSIMGKGPYLNEGEACALSTACGVMIRLSAYTGQLVTLNDLVKNEKSPFYSMACRPTPADFECEGDVAMPEYGDDKWPLPGAPWRGFKKA